MAKQLDIGIGEEKTVFLGKKVQVFLLCCVLPMALSYFAYYGFITNYTNHVFSLYDFHRQYDHHIFRYRVLGKLLLLGYYHVFTHFPHPFFKQKEGINQYLLTDTTSLYHCYFLMNSFFLCLTTWVLSVMFRLKEFEGSAREKQLWLLLIIFLMVISQFVVTPYDTISYFFLSLSIYLMLCCRNGFVLAALLVTMLLAALTRETAAISLSFYATLYLMRKALPNQTSLLGFVLLLLTFLGTYLGLRIAFGWHNGTNEGLQPYEIIRSTASLAFMFSLTVLIVDFRNAARRKAVLVFFVLSLPYLISILLTGILFEIRLWIPLLIGTIILTMLRYRDDQDLTLSLR